VNLLVAVQMCQPQVVDSVSSPILFVFDMVYMQHFSVEEGLPTYLAEFILSFGYSLFLGREVFDRSLIPLLPVFLQTWIVSFLFGFNFPQYRFCFQCQDLCRWVRLAYRFSLWCIQSSSFEKVFFATPVRK